MPATAPAEKPNRTDNARIGVTAWRLARTTWPSWSVDELLIHPKAAIKLCEMVRGQMSIDRPDHDILRALVNARKRGAAIGTARRSRK